MPKIDAPTIAEHVSRRESEILDAAARLFAEHGLAETSMAQIADAVGVARSAIYRYFPSKEHILVASFERRVPELIAEADAAAAEAATAMGKLERWLVFQVDYAVDPAHRIGRRLHDELYRLPAEFQQAIADGHERLTAPLGRLVTEAMAESKDTRDPEMVAVLMNGLLQAATHWAMTSDDGDAATDGLLDAVRRLMPSASG